MNRFRAVCVSLALAFLQVAIFAQAQDTLSSEPETLQPSQDAELEPGAVSGCCDCQACCFGSGLFVGIGGSYNSVRANSVLSGSGVSNIFSGAQLVAIGTAGGPAAPIRETETTFAPVLQAGYFQNFRDSEFLWGAKFSYKYLGITLSENNIDAPQVGLYQVLNPPSTSTMTGNATINSAQTLVSHELALLPFLGHDYTRGRVYVGGGPVVFDTKSKLYGLRSFADINGVHTNVGGQPLNLGGTNWMWGGAVQIGLMHYLSRSCYLDVNYDFMVTGINRFTWDVSVTSESNGLTYQTDIHYREELRLWAQSLNATVNISF